MSTIDRRPKRVNIRFVHGNVLPLNVGISLDGTVVAEDFEAVIHRNGVEYPAQIGTVIVPTPPAVPLVPCIWSPEANPDLVPGLYQWRFTWLTELGPQDLLAGSVRINRRY